MLECHCLFSRIELKRSTPSSESARKDTVVDGALSGMVEVETFAHLGPVFVMVDDRKEIAFETILHATDSEYDGVVETKRFLE